MRAARIVIVVGACLTMVACAPTPIEQIYNALKPPPNNVCADGWPAKLLQDPACHFGICGYTCAPDRWRRKPLTLTPQV